ncbi:type II secretion system protein GspM [Pseudooceanicola sp. MF1-13]|uniref:type II secretion system protein GspM n=1 Tax=Pseudooceanicola sp. MF1-13 TaxID=3379095 RepID=UPI003891D5F4
MSALSSLNARERVMMIGGGLFLIALLGWQFAWRLILVEQAELKQDMARYLMLAQVADEVGSVSQTTGSVPSIPLAQRVTRSADAAGVTLARLDPDGTRLRVTVERAPFADLILWVEALQAREGARPVALQIERLTEPGIVTARLTLEAMQ